MVRRYGRFPTTADVGIWASGGTVAELYEALGLGLFALMTDPRRVRARESRTVHASGPDASGLVVSFLEALLVLEDTEKFLVRRIHARPVGSPPTAILANLEGEPFDPARHSRRMEVKAITLHELVVDLDRYKARVIVDI